MIIHAKSKRAGKRIVNRSKISKVSKRRKVGPYIWRAIPQCPLCGCVVESGPGRKECCGVAIVI